jgi:NAD(P)-dependent dehydrogenase (short-subunit alcohol dehydrogenase family)
LRPAAPAVLHKGSTLVSRGRRQPCPHSSEIDVLHAFRRARKLRAGVRRCASWNGVYQKRVCAVTGASAGIGEAVVRVFVERGARVALLARRQDRLESLAQELGRSNAMPVQADVCDLDSLRAAAESIRDEFGRVDCVINNPPGTFDAVLLLETMLAFRDKETLVDAISRALSPRGRFAFTVEEGMPLTESERARMPDADTVWLTPLDEMHALLARAGLAVRWQKDWSRSHRAVAESLAGAYTADASAIASQIGRRALDDLLAGHRLWTEWLASGRVRKIAVVAERPAKGCARAARVARLRKVGLWMQSALLQKLLHSLLSVCGRAAGLDERTHGNPPMNAPRSST